MLSGKSKVHTNRSDESDAPLMVADSLLFGMSIVVAVVSDSKLVLVGWELTKPE